MEKKIIKVRSNIRPHPPTEKKRKNEKEKPQREILSHLMGEMRKEKARYFSLTEFCFLLVNS